MRVLIEGGIAVWIFTTDSVKQVHCFIEGYEVIISLDAPHDATSAETGDRFLVGKTLRVVQRNLASLLAKWDEMTS